MSVKPKAIPDIVANLRESADRVMSDDHNETCWNNLELGGIYHVLANEIEAAWKHEAEKIERIVRDAVVDYNGLYTCAPNDDAEREVVERAEIANAFLTAHGMAPEPFHYSKEESPCL